MIARAKKMGKWGLRGFKKGAQKRAHSWRGDLCEGRPSSLRKIFIRGGAARKGGTTSPSTALEI